MRYSFLRPKPKKRFDQESRLLFIFMVTVLIMMVGFALFLLFKRISYGDTIAAMQAESQTLSKQSAHYDKEIKRVQKLARTYETIQTNNALLKESLRNLFDLVPDQITLTKAELTRNGLVLYGVTPSKDVYNYLLLAPLKSVFQQNTTSFYPIRNGWWRFVSINEGSIENESGADE